MGLGRKWEKNLVEPRSGNGREQLGRGEGMGLKKTFLLISNAVLQT